MNSGIDNELFKQKAIEVAAFYGISTAQCWDELPESFRGLIVQIEYRALIVPLVWNDRDAGLTWQQLSIKYRVSVQTIRTTLGKRSKHALKTNAATPPHDPIK